MKKLSLVTLPHAILSFIFYLSLVRGTNIGLFYPADEFMLGSIDYTPQTVMNFTLLLGILGYFFVTKNYSFIVKSLSISIIACICVGVVSSMAFSVDRTQSAKYILAMLVIMLPTILYAKEFGVEGLLHGLVKFIVAMAVLNILYVLALPQYGIMVERHAGRWRGLFEHKNGAGPFFACAIPFLLYDLRSGGRTALLLKLLAVIISLVFVVMSQSSTALVAFALLVLLFPSFYAMLAIKSPKERIGAVMIFLASTVVMLTFFGGMFEQFFFEATGRDATLTGRTGIWAVLLDLVAKSPLVGYGPGMSERPEFMAQIQSAVGWEVKGTHNSYFDLLINYGYPTTLLMVFLIFKIWGSYFSIQVANYQNRKIVALAASIVLTVLIIAIANAAAIHSRSIIWVFAVAGLYILGNFRKRTIFKTLG